MSNRKDFSTYAIFIPHIINILDQNALKSYPKVILIETINDCYESINQKIILLMNSFNKINSFLTNFSNIIPEPSQWLGNDILFFNDTRKYMLEFNYFTQHNTFNIKATLLIIKKCLLEVVYYIDNTVQLKKVADARYFRTSVSLSIHGIKTLSEMLCPFLGNAEEIMNKLLNVSFISHDHRKIQFGTQINFDQIMIKFKERLNATSR